MMIFLELFENLAMDYGIFIILFFIIFLFIAKFVLKLTFQLILIIFISAIFPILANKALGLMIPINLETILYFALLGLAASISYYSLKLLWKVSEIVAKTIEYIAESIENFIKILKESTTKKKEKGAEKKILKKRENKKEEESVKEEK